jgi:hypothetical protein
MMRALEERGREGEIDRKLRLYACCCVRRIWYMLGDERSRKAVEIAESYADGMADRSELDAAHDAAEAAAGDIFRAGDLDAAYQARYRDPDANRGELSAEFEVKAEARAHDAAKAAAESAAVRLIGSHAQPWKIFEGMALIPARRAPLSAFEAVASVSILKAREEAFLAGKGGVWLYEDSWQSDRLRCIFGNPFRPTMLAPEWLTPDVVALALGIYAERAFDRMPILGDALEDAGCADPGLLAHCRETGEHVRGCWVIDALLGKS